MFARICVEDTPVMNTCRRYLLTWWSTFANPSFPITTSVDSLTFTSCLGRNNLVILGKGFLSPLRDRLCLRAFVRLICQVCFKIVSSSSKPPYDYNLIVYGCFNCGVLTPVSITLRRLISFSIYCIPTEQECSLLRSRTTESFYRPCRGVQLPGATAWQYVCHQPNSSLVLRNVRI